MTVPKMAKHFLVFVATTWEVDQKNELLVARCALGTIKVIHQLAVLLIFYGFIVDTIVGDGESENRSAFKMLHCIISLPGRYLVVSSVKIN